MCTYGIRIGKRHLVAADASDLFAVAIDDESRHVIVSTRSELLVGDVVDTKGVCVALRRIVVDGKVFCAFG